MNDFCVGIDLGTTNTVCAVWERGQKSPRVISITQPYNDFTPQGFKRETLLASALTIQPEGAFVGFAARYAGRIPGLAASTFTSIKRQMGRRWARRIGSVEWTPERVSACILSAVRRELETIYDCAPKRAVITVPASFGTEARRATLRAARLAGFDPATLRLFDEPTAALLSELQNPANLPAEGERRNEMVIDIGGGTLDVSLVQLAREGSRIVADVQGRSRYNELAGDDFDLAIAGLLLARYEAERAVSMDSFEREEREALCVDLLCRAEAVKQRLSIALAHRPRSGWGGVKEPLTITQTPDKRAWRTEVSGEDLLMALRGFFPFSDNAEVRRDEFSFFRPIQQCLDSASMVSGGKITPDDIQCVRLAGGSALLPVIRMAIKRIVFAEPVLVSDPLLAIAAGAAWYAGTLEGYADLPFEVQDRLFDGIFLQTSNGRFVELISPREIVPMAARSYLGHLFMPRYDRRLDVNLFMGIGDDDPHMVPLARRRVDFGTLIPQGAAIALQVEVTGNRQVEFAFDTTLDTKRVSGYVEVSAASSWERDDECLSPLPPVNEPSSPGAR